MGGFGGGGGSSFIFGYTTNGSAGGSASIATSSELTGSPSVNVTTNTTPFVPPIQANELGGAAGAGATTTTSVGANGGKGQAGYLQLTWYYTAQSAPTVTNVYPSYGEFIQGSPGRTPRASHTSRTSRISDRRPSNWSEDRVASLLQGPGRPEDDYEYVTINVQPNEVFSYVEGCSAYLSIGGPGFSGGDSGKSGGPYHLAGRRQLGWSTGLYIGGTDTGG